MVSRSFEESDLPRIQRIYDFYNLRCNASTVRDLPYWTDQLRYAGNPEEDFRVVERDGAVQAYARSIQSMGVFRISALIESVLDDTNQGIGQGVLVVVSEGGERPDEFRVVYRRDPDVEMPSDGDVYTTSIFLHGITWQLSFWHGEDVVEERKSWISIVVLFAGVSLSGLLALAIPLAPILPRHHAIS